MKHLTQFITEYIVKKKLDKAIDSEKQYDYFPKTREELIDIIKGLLNKGETNLNCIDTSNITDMVRLFSNASIKTKIKTINIDISGWNVHNVKSMKGMFFEYNNFNCDLSGWDVSNVKDMSFMFDNCKKFEGKGIENWNVSNIKYMSFMFDGCTSLKNKPSWYKE